MSVMMFLIRKIVKKTLRSTNIITFELERISSLKIIRMSTGRYVFSLWSFLKFSMKFIGKKLNILREVNITKVINTERIFTFLVLEAKRQR